MAKILLVVALILAVVMPQPAGAQQLQWGYWVVMLEPGRDMGRPEVILSYGPFDAAECGALRPTPTMYCAYGGQGPGVRTPQWWFIGRVLLVGKSRVVTMGPFPSEGFCQSIAGNLASYVRSLTMTDCRNDWAVRWS